jgi:alpha-L-rhamnosidase
MCGICIDGENHFMIAPKPGGNFNHVEANYQSVYGRVKSGWEKTEGGYLFRISIPENTTASFIFPEGEQVELKPGEHILEV